MGVGERIKYVRKAINKTQQSFADAIGLKRNTIANYEIGNVEPSDRTISDICREFGVSEEWLRTGTGDMFVHVDADQELQDIFAEITISGDDLIKRIIKNYWKLPDKQKEMIHEIVDGLIAKNTPEE